MLSSEKRKILVYVQAMPINGGESSSREKSFQDFFQNARDVTLTHSSKVALSKALLLGTMDVTAVGYAPVLHEAMARGASSAISVPACDTPYEQARTFPQGNYEILLGENSDGLFSGASLAGALVALYGYSFRIWDDQKLDYSENSVVLVRDLLLPTPSVDIRRIKRASEEKFDTEAVLGNSRISSIVDTSFRREVITGSTEELSSALVKRLRRNLIPNA